MSVMTVQIDDSKREALKMLASFEDKSITGIISSLIEKYIDEKQDVLSELSENENLKEIMKISEISFSEWDNKEDEVYDTL